jgi:biotin carboxyl carrier protein
MTRRVVVRLNGREHEVDFDGAGCIVNGHAVSIDSITSDGACGLAFDSNHRHLVSVLDAVDDDLRVLFRGREFTVEYEAERHRLLKQFASLGSKSHVHAEVKASMPGLVVRVNCHPGMEVKKGQAIIILEAMKMENEIRSPVDGVLKEVRVQQGQAVEKGDLLVVLDR